LIYVKRLARAKKKAPKIVPAKKTESAAALESGTGAARDVIGMA